MLGDPASNSGDRGVLYAVPGERVQTPGHWQTCV